MPPGEARAIGRWRKFLALDARSQWRLVQAWLLMLVFWPGLRWWGWPTMRAAVERRRFAPCGLDEAGKQAEALTTAALVNRAARFPRWPRACLARSLLLIWLLRGRGIDAELRIGVRMLDGQLDAHAWVTRMGVPINDKTDIGEDFADVGELPAWRAFNAD